MHADVQLNLALILFLPWYLILGALYWIYPRKPRNRRRRVFDVFALVVATVASALSMYWSMFNADPKWGHMWQQVLATSVSYGVFLGVMTVALVVRYRWVTRTRDR